MTKLSVRFFICCLLGFAGAGTLSAQQAQESLVVIVSSQQSIVALNLQQIEDLFLGRSRVFPDGSAAIPVDHSENSQLRQQFYEELLGRSAAQIRSHWARQVFTGRGRPPQTVSSTEELLKLIRDDARIISYIHTSSLSADIKVVFE